MIPCFFRVLANYLGWVTVPSLTSRLPKPFKDAYVVLEKALEGKCFQVVLRFMVYFIL